MIFVRDRVKQGTTTTGAGTVTLDSSFAGYQNFSVLDNGSQTYYAIEESSNWEVGIGTYSSNTLTRDTVLAGASGDGTPIYLSGSATIFITYPSSGAVFTSGNVVSLTGINLGVSGVAFNDDTTQGTAFSYASGVQIDLNDSRISTIETTGVALTGSVSALAASGVGYSSRISTIETTGVALSGSASALAASGVTYYTGIYNTSGQLRTDLIATGNALESSSFSASSGARVDLNDSRISTIETTGVALTGSVSALAASGVGYSSRISTIETTGVALSGSASALAVSGVGYSSRISTIETTGVALSGSASALAVSGVGYSSRISTIETTGVALTGSVSALAASGVTYYTGIYNTSGQLRTDLIATGNALESSSFSASSGAKVDLNTSRVTTIMTTGVALTGSASALAASGVGYSSRISTIETTGVALSGSASALAASGVGYSSRISTIETSGLATISSNLTTVMSTGVGIIDTNLKVVMNSGIPTINTNLNAVMQTGEVMPGASGLTLGVVDTNLKTVMTTGVSTIDTNLKVVMNSGIPTIDTNLNAVMQSGGSGVPALISGAGGAKKTFDLSTGSTFTHTLDANTTFYLANVTQGQKFVLRTEQDSGGTNSVTWGFGDGTNGVIKWAEGGTVPTGTYYGGKADAYGFIAIATGLYDGFIIGSNI